MRTTLVSLSSALLAAATLALAQDNVPECASTCLVQAAGSTSCDTSDLQCLCGDVSFQNNFASCLSTTCTSQDQIDAGLMIGVQTCQAVGVEVTTSDIQLASSGEASSSMSETGAPSSVMESVSSAVESATESASSDAAGATESATGGENSAGKLHVGAGMLAAVVAAAVAL